MASKKTGNKKLNQNEIAFCQYYVSEEFFCSGVKAYSKAYPNAEYNTAKTEAGKFLTKPYILNYIDSLLTDMALNDQRADKELAKMLLQDEDKASKIKALDMYYKITARIEKGLQKAIDKGDVNPETGVLSKLNKLLGSD